MLKDTGYLISNAKALNMNPEQYRKSRERISILSAMIQNADAVQTVRDLIREVKTDIDNEVLELLQNPATDPNLLRGYQHGILMVERKIETIIHDGQVARERLEQIKKSQKGE